MIRKAIVTVGLAAIAAGAWAQEPRVEISVTAGWMLNEGVSGEAVEAEDGNIYNRIDPKNSPAWGAQIGFLATENAEIGFLFNQQPTSLEVSGNNTREIGDLNVYNYHVYGAYNFGFGDAPVRPYLMGGAGFTQYGTLNFTPIGGGEREIKGGTKFSTTWGLGVKIIPTANFGLRAGLRWTPTYIKSDAAGWWCDPWWGCYVVGNSQYSNQFDFSGGVLLRF
jgi:opacity protein-like surface antigen